MKYVNLNAYSFEAMLNAIIDMGYTPFIQVNVHRSSRDFILPNELVDGNGIINFNIAAKAVRNYELDKEKGYLSFDATFNRKHSGVLIPCESITAIFARENPKAVCVFKPNVAFLTEDGVLEGMEPIEVNQHIRKTIEANTRKSSPIPTEPLVKRENNVIQLSSAKKKR